MKNYSKALLPVIFLTVLLFPNSSFAVSGACSNHGGVNCSVGAGALGNAMCSDGFQSSTSYYSADECSNVSYCFQPVTTDCDANMLGGITIQQNMSGMGNTIMGQGAIQGCKDAHIQYQAQLATYNSCISTKSSQSGALGNTTNTLQEWITNIQACNKISHSFFDDSTNPSGQCTCNKGYQFNSQKECVLIAPTSVQQDSATNWCTDQHGSHAVISQYNQKDYCGCADGYTTDARAQCVLMGPSYCADTYGINSHAQGAGCVCNDGYKGGENKQCILSAQTSTSSQSIASTSINEKVVSNSNLNTTPYSRTLRYKMTGNDVKILQQSFIKLGYLSSSSQATILFGKLTRNAVIKFQIDNEITPAQGVFGPLTQKMILQKLQTN